jgi:hypothetical protein
MSHARTYAAELDENNIVQQVIVGTAEWATDNLGGTWVDCDPCGPGWVYVDGEMVPPYVEPDEDEELNADSDTAVDAP